MAALTLDFSILPRDEKVLVACSGGADSLALLLALHQAGYSCITAHINHGTRGKENEDDESFVRDFCEKLNIPFVVAHLQILHNAGEAAMRDARYSSLVVLALKNSCARIATGHSANDVLETMILNLLRDATSTGWSGISPQRELTEGVLLVRPMLEVTRAQVLDFLKAENWTWREDPSNDSSRYLRNRVRHEVVPKLIEISGGDATRIVRQAGRSAEILREDFIVLENLASTHMSALMLTDEENLLILDGVGFRDLSVGLQRRVLRLAVEKLEGHKRDVSFERVEEVRHQVGEDKRRAVWMWKKTLQVEWTGAMAGNRIRFKRV